jgi:hypothetical protein
MDSPSNHSPYPLMLNLAVEEILVVELQAKDWVSNNILVLNSKNN